MKAPVDDGLLDDMIEALMGGPMTHDQLVRALASKRKVSGSTVNSWLYYHRDRFFIPDREPEDGLPVWRLSETVRRHRLKKAGSAPTVRQPPSAGGGATPSVLYPRVVAGDMGFDRKAFKRSRKQRRMTQQALADQLGVSQPQVSMWERGTAVPSVSQITRIQEVFGTPPTGVAPAPRATGGSSSAASFGDWVAEQRLNEGISQAELAERAQVSMQSISNIETGRTPNPRPSTRRRIEAALGESVPTTIATRQNREAEIEGIGEYQDFDPHDANDYPGEPGVYVFYDRSDRPIYVGRSSNIARRVRQHADKFWFKSPIVDRAAFIPVADDALRVQIEGVLIKFLRSNAVLNQKGVET